MQRFTGGLTAAWIKLEHTLALQNTFKYVACDMCYVITFLWAEFMYWKFVKSHDDANSPVETVFLPEQLLSLSLQVDLLWAQLLVPTCHVVVVWMLLRDHCIDCGQRGLFFTPPVRIIQTIICLIYYFFCCMFIHLLTYLHLPTYWLTLLLPETKHMIACRSSTLCAMFLYNFVKQENKLYSWNKESWCSQ